MIRKPKPFFNFILPFLVFVGQVNGQMRQVYLDPGGDYKIIQRISFYSASQGYIASSDNGPPFVGFTTDSGRTFTKRFITLGNVNYNGYYVNLTFGFGISGVKAFSQDTIIAYGDYGLVPAILYSTNGGISYVLVYHSQFSSTQLSTGITDMVFPENNNIGYAVDADRILKTTNKGLSWSVVRIDPDSYFNHIEAVDNNNLVTFSNEYNANKLLKTTNAGSAWQTVTLPVPATGSRIFYSTFLTANKGWLNIRDNNDSLRVFYTSNGGTSWVQKNHTEASPFGCFKMKFVNDSTGFAIAGVFTTYKTTDSGKVWQPLPRDNNFSFFNYYHYDIQCLNENQLWCGGHQDFLELSTNGGGTPIPKAFFRIDTVNSYTNNIVKLWNYSKPGYQFKWYVNNNLVSTSYNTTYTHNTFSPADSVLLIVTSGAASDTVKKYQYFSVPNLPTITSFMPVTGSNGTFVTITGTNFTGVTGVSIGGTPVASFTIVSNTQITLIVGNGATGSISVNNPFGGYSLPGFTYFAPPSSSPPVITGFNPTTGPIGTTVTITGNNFGATATDNSIYFGAVKGSITSASPTQIICTVPAGASFEPFTIINKTNNLLGQSFKPFGVTFADSSNFATNSFINIFNISYGPTTRTKHVSGKDLDGDGKPDLITAITAGSVDSVLVHRNISVGSTISFGPKIILTSIPSASVALFEISDVDGDNKPDIVNTSNGNGITILRNTSSPGAISFTSPTPVLTGSSGNQQSVIADFNNDGKNDIATAGFSSKSIGVIKNTSVPGYLSFGPPTTYSITNNPFRIAAGDLNNDGKKDIVCYNYTGSGNTNFSIFRNTSSATTISFDPAVDVAVAGSSVSSQSIVVVDYDNDNKLDVLTFNDQNLSIYRNITTGSTISFAPAVVIPFGSTGYYSIVANLSGDSKPDIVIGNNDLERVFRLIRNRSTPGTIINDNVIKIGGVYPNVSFPNYTNSGDFDLDGKMDIVTSSSSDGLVSIFRNRIGEAVPFSPSNICAGTTQQRPSDVTGSTYQWQQNTGSGFVNISDNTSFSGTQTSVLTINAIPFSWNGYLYRCIVDGNLYSSSFVMNVNSTVPPTVSISTPTTTICYGDNISFTATGTPIGPLTSYAWQINNITVQGQTSTVFTTNTLTDGAQVKALVFNACSNPNTVSSNVVAIAVNGQPPSVTISTSNTTICTGASTTFTAAPVNGGASPSYQWQVNGVNVGTNSNIFTTNTLTHNDQVKVLLTAAPTSCSTYAAVTSNIITMTVNTPTAASVSITASNTTVCSGAQVSFSATAVNGGSSPTFQWQLNGVNVGNPGNYYQAAFTATSMVQVILTSNSNCVTTTTATSNIITITVLSNVTPTITISGNNTVTTGQSTTIISSIANGGSGPTYQWQDSTNIHTWQNISGATSASINYSPTQTGNKLRSILTSNAACALPVTATSNGLIFTVNPVTAIPPVAATNYGIRYFPNPVHDILIIDSLKLNDKWQLLYIYDLNGRRIKNYNIGNRTSISLNTTMLAAGQYVAVLRKKTGIPVYLKFIKL
jgi:hypothetical protein